MRTTCKTVLILASLCRVAPTGAAPAQTVLSGHYDHHDRMNVDGGGYRTRAGRSYVVAPGATFEDNDNGLVASAAAVTVTGGAFHGNAFDGLLAENGARVTLTGGVFRGNGECDLYAADSGTSITLVGTGLKFSGAARGTVTLSSGDLRDGTVTGTLRGNAAPSRLSFRLIADGRITLVNVPRPGTGASRPQTVLRGHHDHSPNGHGGDGSRTVTFSGYETARGRSYVAAPGATFNDNQDGLDAEGVTVAVTGGAFRKNAGSGLVAVDSHVTITGGAFTGSGNSGLYADHGATVTVSGGTFTKNHGNVLARAGARVTITGGAFGVSETECLFADGAGTSLTLVGQGLRFAGAPAGATTLTNSAGSFRAGVVTGTLRNNARPSRLSFSLLNGACLTLVNAPRPRR